MKLIVITQDISVVFLERKQALGLKGYANPSNCVRNPIDRYLIQPAAPWRVSNVAEADLPPSESALSS